MSIKKAEKDTSTGSATLHLTITYNQVRVLDVIDSAREVIEKACEQGGCEGFLEMHSTGRIDVEDLR